MSQARTRRIGQRIGQRAAGASRTARARFGFTLVEVIVALGIIALLTGLTVTMVSAGLARARVNETNAILQQLDAAERAWTDATGRRIRRADRPNAELDPETEYIFVISEVLAALERSPEARDRLAGIAPRRTHRYSNADVDQPPIWIRTYTEEHDLPDHLGQMVVFDAWGTPIYATHPGEPIGAGGTSTGTGASGVGTGGPGPVDADGTERTPNEFDFGSAPGRRICFVSAGPDRRFGLSTEFPGLSAEERGARIREARRDNQYSQTPIFHGPN